AANANGTGYASFTFQVQDNGGTANGGVDLDQSPNSFTFNVTAINDAPVIDLQGSVSGVQTAVATAAFSEGGGAVTVASDLTVSDVDSGTLTGATVTLGNPQASDVLLLQGQAGTSGTLASGIAFVIAGATVTFSNTASLADYQAA